MPTIRTEIFTQTFTTAPQIVSPPIVSLCRELNPDQTPIWVPVRSDPDAIVNECFDNVSAKVARDRGAIVYGWLIWEWPRVFIEAEHHAVWEESGALIDITPNAVSRAAAPSASKRSSMLLHNSLSNKIGVVRKHRAL